MQRNNSFSLRGIAVSGLVILFFVGIILSYYFMLLSETRERITKTGELNAMTSAEQIDQYLSQGIVTINLACYTLDSMIRSEKSQAEIRGFLVDQSNAVLNSALKTTGMYGYIKGEYLDGTECVPDADFVPPVVPPFPHRVELPPNQS